MFISNIFFMMISKNINDIVIEFKTSIYINYWYDRQGYSYLHHKYYITSEPLNREMREALNVLEVENQSWEFVSTIITAQIFNWKFSCSLCFTSINRKTIMAIMIHLLFHTVLYLKM